jgi:hypothetical protein
MAAGLAAWRVVLQLLCIRHMSCTAHAAGSLRACDCLQGGKERGLLAWNVKWCAQVLARSAISRCLLWVEGSRESLPAGCRFAVSYAHDLLNRWCKPRHLCPLPEPGCMLLLVELLPRKLMRGKG